MAYSIYIADDEENIRALIKSFLESDGYKVADFKTGDDLFEAFKVCPCDLAILDIMMPGTDGLTVCRNLREITDIPIIMLTAKDTEYDYVQGITIGSDDYLTKPFRPTTLLMRVRSLLRRMEMNETRDKRRQIKNDITVGNLKYSAEQNAVFCENQPVNLTQTELKMLLFMLRNPKKAYSREDLLENVWGYGTGVETRVTDETLRRIRKKLSLSKSNVRIRTIWDYGYTVEVSEE